MFDIISTLFESLVSFLETVILFVQFVITNIGNLFGMINWLPDIIKAPVSLALVIVVVLGIKKAVLA